jgi:hypothetical protein
MPPQPQHIPESTDALDLGDQLQHIFAVPNIFGQFVRANIQIKVGRHPSA